METDWAENRAKIQDDIIRRTLGKVIDGIFLPRRSGTSTAPGWKRATSPGTVEIYISHRGMMEIYPNEAKNQTIWQPRPADPELEAEFLQRLMVHWAPTRPVPRRRSLPCPRPRRPACRTSKAVLRFLEVQEGFDRAWAQGWSGAGSRGLHRRRP